MPYSSVHFIIGILNIFSSKHKFLCLHFCWKIWLMCCAFHIWIRSTFLTAGIVWDWRVHAVLVQVIAFILCTRRQTFLHNYNTIILRLRTHSAGRPFLHFALAGGEVSNTLCIWLSQQIISRLSSRQWRPLSGASFPLSYRIWQEAGPTRQSCSFVVL